MTTKEYIASGKLEMYVLGHLSEQENFAVAKLRRADSEINLEIDKIEAAIIQLTATLSPTVSSEMMDAMISNQTAKSSKLEKKKETNWSAILGWSFCLLLLLTATYFGYENSSLIEYQVKSQKEKTALLAETDSIKQQSVRTETILNFLKLPATQKQILESEDNSTDVTATLFYNHNELTAILDLANLPVLGQGEVYQLWSVTETEQELLYNSVFIKDFSKKESNNLYLLDGVTADRFVLSIETDSNTVEPSPIRFIQKENYL